MVIHTMNRADVVDWLGDKLFKYNIARQDVFERARAIGHIHGCEVYVSSNTRRGGILSGNNSVGLHYYVYVPMQLLGPQWDPSTNTMAILRRQRAAIKVTQSNTLGYLKIT
jgi:hypothetical protein